MVKKSKKKLEKFFAALPSKVKAGKSTLELTEERDIAMDFAVKAYEKFGKVIKSIILFGSSAKGTASEKSDIDVVILIDDATIQWDQELIAWYREELGKIVQTNPYKKSLHLNTVRLSTWWNEMLRGEPVVINIIRWGEALIDFGGFFNPLKVLLAKGLIKGTPESIFITLGRTPGHMLRSKMNLMGAVEGLYWAFVDASHAALMAAKISPPSPEHIPELLKNEFVKKGTIKSDLVDWYVNIYTLMHKILRGQITDIKGTEIDKWRERTDLFVREMAKICNRIAAAK